MCEIPHESPHLTVQAFKNKIAIITGAGAVENAWEPILKIFKPLMEDEVDADVINCHFAKLIYLLRIYSSASDKMAVENLEFEKETMKQLKDLISEHIKIYQQNGILRARKEFKDILAKFVFAAADNLFGLVSTNWDTVIDKEADEIVKEVYVDLTSTKCFHLHGSIDSPEHLYLPSETSKENYRSKEDNDRHGYNHFATLKFLKEARQIILYGISLEPLDAELIQILNSTFTTSNNLREIIIVNPDFKRIRKRIKALLFPKNDISIKCFVPENLEYEV